MQAEADESGKEVVRGVVFQTEEEERKTHGRNVECGGGEGREGKRWNWT